MGQNAIIGFWWESGLFKGKFVFCWNLNFLI